MMRDVVDCTNTEAPRSNLRCRQLCMYFHVQSLGFSTLGIAIVCYRITLELLGLDRGGEQGAKTVSKQKRPFSRLVVEDNDPKQNQPERVRGTPDYMAPPTMSPHVAFPRDAQGNC